MKKSLLAVSLLTLSLSSSAQVDNSPKNMDLFFNGEVEEYCGVVLENDTAGMGFEGSYISDTTLIKVYHNGLGDSKDHLTLKLKDVDTGGFNAPEEDVSFQVTTDNEGVKILSIDGNTEIEGDLTGDIEVRATLVDKELDYPAGNHTVTAGFELRCKR